RLFRPPRSAPIASPSRYGLRRYCGFFSFGGGGAFGVEHMGLPFEDVVFGSLLRREQFQYKLPLARVPVRLLQRLTTADAAFRIEARQLVDEVGGVRRKLRKG